MFAQPIHLSIDGGLDLNFPKMTLVRQNIAPPALKIPHHCCGSASRPWPCRPLKINAIK